MTRLGTSRRVRVSFLLSRMGSYRLVLSAALLTAIVTATLTAAIASFASGALPLAIHHQLATAHGASISVSGAINAQLASKDDRVVRRTMRATFGDSAVTISGARWSDPLGLAPQGSRGGHGGRGVTRLVEAAALDGITGQASLTAGSWPGRAPASARAPMSAAVPAAVASQLHLALGEMLTLRDRVTGARLGIRVTGIFRPKDQAAPYWRLTPAGSAGSDTSGSFVTYGPLIVNPAAFSDRQLAVGGASWLVRPLTIRISANALTTLAGRINSSDRTLTQSPQLGGLQVSTSMPGLLQGIAKNDVVARSLLAIGELQLLLLTMAALALAASLLASQREGETAMLSARGGARWQLARLGWAEAALLAVTAVAVGSVAGGWLASRLARSGTLRAAGLRLPATPDIIWAAAGVVGLLCAALLLGPAFRTATPGAARTRAGRPARAAGIARALR